MRTFFLFFGPFSTDTLFYSSQHFSHTHIHAHLRLFMFTVCWDFVECPDCQAFKRQSHSYDCIVVGEYGKRCPNIGFELSVVVNTIQTFLDQAKAYRKAAAHPDETACQHFKQIISDAVGFVLSNTLERFKKYGVIPQGFDEHAFAQSPACRCAEAISSYENASGRRMSNVYRTYFTMYEIIDIHAEQAYEAWRHHPGASASTLEEKQLAWQRYSSAANAWTKHGAAADVLQDCLIEWLDWDHLLE